MEFKIDTKSNYIEIIPQTDRISANMAVELRQKVNELTQKDSTNFIVDLSMCIEMDVEAGDLLMELHQTVYGREGSLVFIGLQDPVLQLMKKEQWHLSLNISPTRIEAIDIINMEILERDILKEQ